MCPRLPGQLRSHAPRALHRLTPLDAAPHHAIPRPRSAPHYSACVALRATPRLSAPPAVPHPPAPLCRDWLCLSSKRDHLSCDSQMIGALLNSNAAKAYRNRFYSYAVNRSPSLRSQEQQGKPTTPILVQACATELVEDPIAHRQPCGIRANDQKKKQSFKGCIFDTYAPDTPAKEASAKARL